VQQVDRLAGAPATGKHVCGRVRTSDGPDEAPEQPTYRPDAPPEPPPMPEPDNRTTDPKGGLYQQPLYLSQVHQAPGDLTGRHARADTPLPMPGARIPEYTQEGRRVPVGSAPVGEADRRLPVPTGKKAEPGTSRQPFILAAVLVAGVGVAAAVVAATLPRNDPAPKAAPATSAPAASASAPASNSPSRPAGGGGSDGAPTGVKLRDNRDAVIISWTYPKDADGPVLISGGRAGQERKVFQQMPPGSSDYVAYGLNDRLDYCFSVAVVYSSDRVAGSDPICTDR
jgi:hypothetical protein